MTAGTQPEIPADMVEVTKDEFFKRLAADARDIMPTTRYAEFTSWETQHSRDVWGWSLPGWKHPMVPAVYAVKKRT